LVGRYIGKIIVHCNINLALHNLTIVQAGNRPGWL
jgi:hypothetical protein